jgi:hypothetical protein
MSAFAGNLSPSVTVYHAKYYAHDLTRRANGGLDRDCSKTVELDWRGGRVVDGTGLENRHT